VVRERLEKETYLGWLFKLGVVEKGENANEWEKLLGYLQTSRGCIGSERRELKERKKNKPNGNREPHTWSRGMQKRSGNS